MAKKTMLDISIKNLDNELGLEKTDIPKTKTKTKSKDSETTNTNNTTNTDKTDNKIIKKIKNFISNEFDVYSKSDGVKVTLLRTDTDYDMNYDKNWIIAYKGNIIYKEEFSHLSQDEIKNHSSGASQFKLIHQMLEKQHKNLKQIPKNTEFFLEFLMKKSTLTRQYKNNHNIILIGFTKSSYEIQNGLLKTQPGKMITQKREQFAELMNIDTPRLIYSGNFEFKNNNLIKSSLSNELVSVFKKNIETLKNYYESDFDLINYYKTLKECLLTPESVYGGTEEGVVLQNKNNDEVYKLLQSDQHDKQTRLDIKNSFKEDPETEKKYYQIIDQVSTNLLNKIRSKDLKQALKELSFLVSSIKIKELGFDDFKKKTYVNILDDIQLTTKTKFIKQMDGNNGALFIGRFQPPTKTHIKIIEDALKEFDYIVIGIVKGAMSSQDLEKNPFSKETQLKIFEEIFSDKMQKKVFVITLTDGLIHKAINKSPKNINSILAGSDRIKGYQNQLNSNIIKIKEIDRNLDSDDEVSATKIRQALRNNDYYEFQKNIDKRVVKFFDTLKNEIQSNEKHTNEYLEYLEFLDKNKFIKS